MFAFGKLNKQERKKNERCVDNRSNLSTQKTHRIRRNSFGMDWQLVGNRSNHRRRRRP